MRTILIAALAASTAMLGGCGTQNRGVESVKQPVVSRTDYTFDAQVTQSGFAPGEADRVAGWLAAMNPRYGDSIAVDDPNPYGEAARRQVAGMVGRYGLLLQDRAPVTAGQIAAGTVRVIVSRASATVPGCPDFSRNGNAEFEGSTTSNYGCATNANLAAMVANPMDLVRGQSEADTTDVQTVGRAVGAYRRATPTGSGGTAIKTESTGSK